MNNIEEIWKDIEETDYHEISTLGRLRNKRNGNILTGRHDKDGYIEYCLCFNKKTIYRRGHRLVMNAFSNPIVGKDQVNHINGIKDDNRFVNLEWVNCSENIEHAFKIGLKTQRGVHNNCSKLTESDIHEIRRMLKAGITHKVIAEKFGLHHLYISLIKNKRRWGWLEEEHV
ncbi:MAG: NUMOD4 domain-containing protein [Sphingobacteriaceae bacterium]